MILSTDIWKRRGSLTRVLERESRIAILLSGGVDSSVALVKLIEAGYKNITAYYLKIWLEDDLSSLGQCPWQEDIEYATAVCEQFSIPLKIVPLQREYHERVVSYTVSELKKGRTPSPDLFCNKMIKLGAFWERVKGEADYIATGHYAVLEETDGELLLKRSPDPVKDQTYFLSQLTVDQLNRLLCPIGEFSKKEIRAIAEQYNLCNKERKDSQGICFLGKIKYTDFVRHYLGEKEGEIIEAESGNCIGNHKGVWFYTIGQRQGLGLSGGPWYVVKKELESNRLYISSCQNGEERARKTFKTTKPNYLSQKPLAGELLLKLRHGPQLTCCSVTPLDSGLFVKMEQGDRGVAPGQFSVFYQGEQCLGSAMIREAL